MAATPNPRTGECQTLLGRLGRTSAPTAARRLHAQRRIGGRAGGCRAQPFATILRTLPQRRLLVRGGCRRSLAESPTHRDLAGPMFVGNLSCVTCANRQHNLFLRSSETEPGGRTSKHCPSTGRPSPIGPIAVTRYLKFHSGLRSLARQAIRDVSPPIFPTLVLTVRFPPSDDR